MTLSKDAKRRLFRMYDSLGERYLDSADFYRSEKRCYLISAIFSLAVMVMGAVYIPVFALIGAGLFMMAVRGMVHCNWQIRLQSGAAEISFERARRYLER